MRWHIDKQDAKSRADVAAAAGARCYGNGRRSSGQLHGTVGDQDRTAAAARRSARLWEDWIGGDDGRSWRSAQRIPQPNSRRV